MTSEERDTKPLPVEKRKVKGLVKHVLLIRPALNEQWVTPRKFIFYVFPPTKLSNGDYIPGAKQKWLESMSYLLDDIWWLCELQYHQFWSQIIFDPDSMKSIKSFLHLAPLQQLYFKIDDQPILLLYKRIKKAVFQFMKRLLRIKESDLNFMSPEKYTEIMEKNDLVPASLLFCLCTLYAKKELETVREMFAHVVQYNNNLKLDTCAVRSIQLFSRMKSKLKKAYRDLNTSMKCSRKEDDVREAMNSYRQNLSSSVQFLANAALNISNFLYVYTEGCEIFLIHDFDFHIVRVYKKLIIPAYVEISILYGDERHAQSCSRLTSMLELTRLEFVKSFHVCLKCLINRLSLRLLAQETIQRIGQLMKMASKVENFIADVNNMKSLNEIHELIKKNCPSDMDLTALNKVFESIADEPEDMKEESNPRENCIEDDHIYDYVLDDYDAESDDSAEFENNREPDNDTVYFTDNSSEYSDWSKNENSDAEYEGYLEEDGSPKKPTEIDPEPVPSTSSVVPISEMDLQSAISQVKDLLPHLGDGFIAICLKAYNMDIAAVINAIFENTLLPSLKEIDFSLANVPRNILEEIKREYEEIPSTSKTEMSGLKEFKRTEYSSYKEMFNDKRAVKQVKSVYEPYRNMEEDELYNDDVDEDYEEQLYAPPVEVDPEGFYTEYANLPTFNPNHHYEIEEENCELEDEKNERPRQNSINNNVHKSSDNRNFRKEKGFDSRQNPREPGNAGRERHYRKEGGNRNRKPLKSYENSVQDNREKRDHNRDAQNSRENVEHDDRGGHDCNRNYNQVNHEEEVTTHHRKPLDFCENPEDIRARAEHRRRVKQEKRRGPKQFYNSNLVKPQREDKEDEEKRDRYFKNVHKSSNANHSRRFFSGQKRRQQ